MTRVGSGWTRNQSATCTVLRFRNRREVLSIFASPRASIIDLFMFTFSPVWEYEPPSSVYMLYNYVTCVGMALHPYTKLNGSWWNRDAVGRGSGAPTAVKTCKPTRITEGLEKHMRMFLDRVPILCGLRAAAGWRFCNGVCQ